MTFGNVRCRVVGRRSHTLVFGFLKWLVTGLVFAQGVAVRAIASIRWLVGALFGGFPRVPEVRVGDHVALFDAISADDGVGEARLIAAMVEIEASKAENDRLRSFLGLDRAARNGSFGTSRVTARDWTGLRLSRPESGSSGRTYRPYRRAGVRSCCRTLNCDMPNQGLRWVDIRRSN